MDSSPAQRSPLLEWILAGWLALLLAVAVFGLGGYAAEVMVAVSAGLAVALALVVSLLRTGWHPAVAWTLPFLAYGVINVLWVSPVPWRGWQDWSTWMQMAAVFAVVLNGVRSRGPLGMLLVAVLLLGLAAALLGAGQRFLAPEWLPLGRTQDAQFFGRASAPFGNPNSLAGLLVLLIPPGLALALRRGASSYERVLFGWMALMLAAGLVLTLSRGGWLALTLALAAWPVWRGWARFRRRGLLIGAAVLVVMAGATWGVMNMSTFARQRAVTLWHDLGERSRPVMWRAAWANFTAHPWVGTGAGSYDVMFEQHRPETEQKRPVWAHNDYLNTLSDYGGIGLLLLGVAVGGAAWSARRERAGASGALPVGDRPRYDPLRSGMVRQGLVVGLVAFALHAFVDFHFKLPGLALTAAALAALAVPRRRDEGPDFAGRWGTIAVGRIGLAVLVLAGGAYAAASLYRAEALRFGARERLDALAREVGNSERTLAEALRLREVLDRAIAANPGNGDAWADRAYVLAIVGHHRAAEQVEIGRAAEADARRALALSAAVPEFWLRLGVALDMQGRWLEAGDAFVAALERAPVNATVWYHHAYHLSLRRVTHPLARAAIATSLRLDPANREAEALRLRLPAGK